MKNTICMVPYGKIHGFKMMELGKHKKTDIERLE